MSDYYRILQLDKGASDRDIKSAFRRLARKYHPDLNPGDEAAEREFKRINEAYEVLSSPESRGKYDRYGDNWKHSEEIEAGGFSRGHGDLFDLLGGYGRSRARSVRRLEASFDISLEEAFHGTKRQVTVTGAKGPRRIEVSIPPGVRSGSRVRVSPSSDLELLAHVKVIAHRTFRRRGGDLEIDAEVPFEVAALGGEARVATMAGQILLKIPGGSGTGRRIRVSGRGMPVLGDPDRRGDLIVTVRPTVPDDLTEEQRRLLETYRQSRADMPVTA